MKTWMIMVDGVGDENSDDSDGNGDVDDDITMLMRMRTKIMMRTSCRKGQDQYQEQLTACASSAPRLNLRGS